PPHRPAKPAESQNLNPGKREELADVGDPAQPNVPGKLINKVGPPRDRFEPRCRKAGPRKELRMKQPEVTTALRPPPPSIGILEQTGCPPASPERSHQALAAFDRAEGA